MRRIKQFILLMPNLLDKRVIKGLVTPVQTGVHCLEIMSTVDSGAGLNDKRTHRKVTFLTRFCMSLCLITACEPASSGPQGIKQNISQSLTPGSKGERLTPGSKGERGRLRAYLKLSPDFAPGLSEPLIAANARISLEGTSLQAISDQRGYFELKDVPFNRTFNVIAEKANARGQNFRVLQSAELSPEKPELELAPLLLQATGRLKGRIQLKDSDAGLAGVDVFIPGTFLAARTDESGDFMMSDVPVGSYRLKMFKEGFAEVSTSLVQILEGSLTEAPLIQLAPANMGATASMTGSIRSQGSSVAGASLTLISPDGQSRVTRSDEKGHYEFKEILLLTGNLDQYQIIVDKLFYKRTSFETPLKAGQDLQHDIDLESTRFYPGRMNLKVYDCQGNAVANALIQLNPSLALSPIIFTDLKGQAKLTVLPPGKYTVQVARGQYSAFDGIVLDNLEQGPDGQSGALAQLDFILGDCQSK